MSNGAGEAIGLVLDGFGKMFSFLCVVAVIALITIPFAIWKWIDIGIWCYYHLHITSHGIAW